MLKRILTATVALGALLPLLIFGGVWAAASLFAVICAVSVYELASCCGLKKNIGLTVLSVLVFTAMSALPVFAYISIYGKFVSSPRDAYQLVGGVFVLTVIPVLVLLCILVLKYKTLDAEKLLMFIAVALYASAGYGALSYLRLSFGLWALWLVFAISWGTDTFAYFTGMAFGKRKLCPDISPKKTVAGAIGGTLFGTAAGVIICAVFTDNALLGLIGLPLSVISQFGDLAASVIKRRFGVKDYGKLFPGHGGVMDRFDSVIAVSLSLAVAASVYAVFVR